jgi:hypothetical protein
MYKLIKDQYENKITGVLANLSACIPFDPDNSDYMQFKKDLVEGVELQDSTGTTMTQAQITTFLETIP